jgi:hypothetical protein
MFEHLQAQHQFERAVRELQIEHALATDVDRRKPVCGELDRLGAEIHSGDVLWEQAGKVRQRLSLAAASVQHRVASLRDGLAGVSTLVFISDAGSSDPTILPRRA